MARYVLARLVLVVPTLWAVATLIFLLVRVIPGTSWSSAW
jgi:ABC-type microcin C transport system permease subunit YejB